MRADGRAHRHDRRRRPPPRRAGGDRRGAGDARGRARGLQRRLSARGRDRARRPARARGADRRRGGRTLGERRGQGRCRQRARSRAGDDRGGEGDPAGARAAPHRRSEEAVPRGGQAHAPRPRARRRDPPARRGVHEAPQPGVRDARRGGDRQPRPPVGGGPARRGRRPPPGFRARHRGRPRPCAARGGPRLRAGRDDGARDGGGGERHGPAGRVAGFGRGRARGCAREAGGDAVSEFLDDGRAALEWVERYLDGVGELPVLAQVKPGDVRAALPASPPDEPEPFSALLEDLDEVLMPGMTHWQHPRFFAYFAASASRPAILAEMLAAALNPVAFLWRPSPASPELEGVATDWVAQLLGLPGGWHGHIEDAASTSTLAAMIAARHVTGRNLAVGSEHAHSALEKGARMLGMELRTVPSDGEYRMRADGLNLSDAAIVVATVGTTSTASVDPVPALADLCARTGTWLHVDAAYAGSAMVCPEFRWAFAGVERADSLVVNAHKWMLTPMDCSLLWTSRPADFRAAFSLIPEYLRTPDEEDALSLSEYGPALGRRFRSLKLWAVLRCHGRAGLQRMIRDHVRLAGSFERWVRDEPGWEGCAPRPFSVVCFRREGSDADNEAILERVNASGEIFISHTRLHDRYVLRLAIGSERTTEEDVRRAWDAIRHAAG